MTSRSTKTSMKMMSLYVVLGVGVGTMLTLLFAYVAGLRALLDGAEQRWFFAALTTSLLAVLVTTVHAAFTAMTSDETDDHLTVQMQQNPVPVPVRVASPRQPPVG